MHGQLVGRGAEVAELERILARHEVRLVTLTGPTGVGKTHLATVTLERADADVVVVRLDPMTSAALMADAIVERIEPGSASGAPADALWQRFSGRRVLMLLDNLEQITGAGDVVVSMLERYGALTVVTTSLRPLGVPGEHVLVVPPLAVPHGAAPGPVPPAPALELFVRRARLADRHFAPDGADLSACAEVCRVLGGLPLAIELAAARIRTVPPMLMAAQLAAGGGLDLLRHDDRGAPARHQSLAAALTWTYALLRDGPAAELFDALSVFEGPITLDAAAVMAPVGHEIVDLVSQLVDLHLVELDAVSSAHALIRLQRPVRAFAARRLIERGAAEEMLRRRDGQLLARVRDGRPLRPYEVPDALATLDRLRLAGQVDTALELALYAGWSLAPGARDAVHAEVESLLAESGRDRVLESRALVWSATHGPAAVGDRQAFAGWTRARVDRAIRAARLSGDQVALLDALELSVRTLGITFDVDLARSSLEEGFALAERAGEAGRLGRFQMWSGMVARADGQLGRAERLLRSARAAGVEAGDRVAADYAAMYLHSLQTESGAPADIELPDLLTLLDSAWEHRDALAASVVLTLLVDRALAAQDAAGAARRVAQMLPIGLERQATEPLSAAAHLAVAVRLLATTEQSQVAAVIVGHLSTLGRVLPTSMAAVDAAAYERAASDLVDALPPDVHAAAVAEGRELSQVEALRRAQRAVAAVVAGAGTPRAHRPASTSHQQPDRTTSSLTARERDVLALLASGSSNPEIARRLRISSKTAMHHTVSI